MHTIVTTVLQQQYLQTELIFWVTLILIDIFNIILTCVILKYAYVSVCVCVYIYIYIYMYVYIYACMFIFHNY